MHSLTKTFAIISTLLILTACGASKRAKPITGSLPAISPENARIYFYRSQVPFLAAVEPEFLVNGKSVGFVKINQVLYRNAQPGNYEIKISSDIENPISILLKPGETRFFKAYGTTSIIRSYHAIKEIAEDAALKEIQGQKLLAPE
ncbi:DUF2846 domain-containing protein [Kiloniella spongiae]|uniref:DUF2846 domain-containing protein n=1 Tax=Kiloniella spongiae TaxID=1489064 RepID=UPI0006996F6D|nr:DUF2846 domain-containing protein [Kiloniella spongiae]